MGDTLPSRLAPGPPDNAATKGNDMPDPMQIIDGWGDVIITPGGSGHIDGKPDGDGIEGFGG